MEKIVQNTWRFIKENKIRFLASIIFSVVYVLYFLKFTQIFDHNIKTGLYIKLMEIFFKYPVIKIFFDIIIITIFYVIIYLILFGKKKIDLKNNLVKILINIGIIFIILFLNKIFLGKLKDYATNIYMYSSILYGGFEKIRHIFYDVTIFEIISNIILGLIINFIFAIIYFSRASAFLSIFLILENKCKSKFSIIEIWKYFSKISSKKIFIFICLLHEQIIKVLNTFNFNIFLQENGYENGIQYNIEEALRNKGFNVVAQWYDFNGIIKFPIIFVIIGFVLIFILLVQAIRMEERDCITEILRGKNFKFYRKAFLLTLVIGGIFCIFFLIGLNTLLKVSYYYSYSYAIIQTIPIFILAAFGIPALFIISEMLFTKFYFEYLGKEITLSVKKFFRIFFHLSLQGIISAFLYNIFIKIVSSIIYEKNSLSELFFTNTIIVIFIVTYLFSFYVVFLLSKFQILEILSNEKVSTTEVIKNSFGYIKKFINIKVLVILFLFMIYDVMSIIYSPYYNSFNIAIEYTFKMVIICGVGFIFIHYFMLYFIDYYLKLKNENKDLSVEENLICENIEKSDENIKKEEN